MLLPSRSRARRRRGVILLVVLSLLTLFTAVGITFVYFSESQATQAANTKEGETLKLPDPDMVFSFALRQIVYPTDNRSALYTHSLLENLYGSSGIAPHNGTGRLARFYRDNTAGVIDPHLAAGYTTNPALIGQDELYRLNFQGRVYDEPTHGALNPPYTYPDHKNPFLGVVAGDWRDKGFNSHGPVALARSFARELKFRIAIVDTTVTVAPNVVGYQEVVINPFSSDGLEYWKTGGINNAGNYVANLYTSAPGWQYPATAQRPIMLPALQAPYQYVSNSVITVAPNGGPAAITLDPAAVQAHTLRPKPYLDPVSGLVKNANFAPPSDFGGDVKNLPPEVKTLVGYDAAGNPMFADNDSYWMDLGFPALRWSNNKKYKPLVALFIMSNDGKVNLNTAGNLRGRDVTNLGAATPTFPMSAYGLHQSEINPMKLGIPLTEYELLLAGRAMTAGATAIIPGRNGFDPGADPITTAAPGYVPLLRDGPFYSSYNLDGTIDGLSAPPEWRQSLPYLIPGQIRNNPPDAATTTFRRWPFYNTAAEGYNNAGPIEFGRGGNPRSPFFTSPFVPDQFSAAIGQRTFGLYNGEALYRASDTGADALNSDIRRLIPTAFATPQQRWMMSVHSADLNSVGAAPWMTNDPGAALDRARYNYYPRTPPLAPVPPPNRDLTGGRISGQPVLPRWTPPTAPMTQAQAGEFLLNSWRSISGNTDRLDLARQLPDYPLPATPDSQLDLTNPVVRAQYFIALRARQRLAMELYQKMVFVTHPDEQNTPGRISYNAKRYLAQLAVNIVDYIDNDDYSTWLIVPDLQFAQPTNEATVVWGTELPRLVLNEIYAEAVTGGTDPVTGNATSYSVRHWVELYNTLSNGAFSAWPDGANARLNIAGTPVYRLLLTTSDNLTSVTAPWDPTTPGSNAIRINPANTLGMPINMAPARTHVVTIPAANGANPMNVVVAPSETSAGVQNYGTGLPDTTTVPANPENRGFYVVGFDQPPEGVLPANFVTTDYNSPRMELTNALPASNLPLNNNRPTNQTAVLLQRLANPHLPYNPVDPTDPQYRPNDPINPYITIDYADHIFINHAITRNGAGNPDRAEPQDRYSVGKIQPFAGFSMTDPATNEVISMWTRQYPDANGATPAREDYADRPQHTFHRHNGENATAPATGLSPDPGFTGGTAWGQSVNTLRLPFDWLVHLDRPPVSPAELLHVSGYRPHELTQQFNQFVTLQGATPATPTVFTGKPAAPVLITTATPVFGTLNGAAWALRNNDLIYITYPNSTPGGQNPLSEWARVDTVQAGNLGFTVWLGQSGQPVTIPASSTVTIRAVVPFAHYAPWFLTTVPTSPLQSTNRLYRFLEFVGVRNPGVDMGQVRYNSVPAGGGNNVDAQLPDGSRWVQLNYGANIIAPTQLPLIRPNDALLGITEGDPIVPPLTPPNVNPPVLPNGSIFVGDTLVAIDAATGAQQRVPVLQIDWQNNRIRTVLNVPAGQGAGAFPWALTFDQTYHSGRQLGRINLNEDFDEPVTNALADVQPMNYLAYDTANPPDSDRKIRRIHSRIIQQRQPMFYSNAQFVDPATGAATFFSSKLPGHTGRTILDPSNPNPALKLIRVPEDRPFPGMAPGDIPAFLPNFTQPYTTQNAGINENATQGIGNTWLSDRYQENSPMPAEATDDFRLLRTLFEVGPPSTPEGLGLDHPYRRYEMLSKIWNNATVRSNTFSVWMTVGYFEYDEVLGLGAELNLAAGKNVRHRFFSIVDRTSIDSWLKSQQFDNSVLNGIEDINPATVPVLDPRGQTYVDPPVFSTAYNQVANSGAPGVWAITVPAGTPFVQNQNYGRLLQVESVDTATGQVFSEVVMMLNPSPTVPPPKGVLPPLPVPPPANTLYARLTINHAGRPLMIRSLPIPPTVLYWSQIK